MKALDAQVEAHDVVLSREAREADEVRSWSRQLKRHSGRQGLLEEGGEGATEDFEGCHGARHGAQAYRRVKARDKDFIDALRCVMAPKKNPNAPGTRQPTLAEVSPVVAALEVPKHLRAEFLKGFGVEWEHAHTVGYDLMLVGGIVLDHLAEDAHYYRKLQRARLNPAHKRPSERVRAAFDALLSSVQEQYPSLSCTLDVDAKAGQRDGQACARAYAFCEDLDDGSFRIAVAAKMNDADDSRVEGLLRHELAHAVLLHGGDMEHTERDADEVAEELFGSPLFYDDEDVQTTDQSAPGARRPRPPYLDGADGRTLDSAEPMGEDGPDAPRGTMQLNTVEDVVSALDDAAAQGDAKTPRLIASQLSQQAKQVGGAQSRTLLTLAKAARHCATGVEARMDGQIDRAMTSERMCDAALQEAAMPRSRMNPRRSPMEKALGLEAGEAYGADEDVPTELGSARILGHKVEFSQNENTSSITGWVKGLGDVGYGYSLKEAKESAREKLAALGIDGSLPWEEKSRLSMDMFRAARSRRNPEWAKSLGSGLYKGARYSAETAHDLYQGARAAHAARSAPVEPERKNPHARHPGFEQYEFRVENSFMPALINGDTSGLDEDDIDALDRFLAKMPKDRGSHWAVIEDDAGFGPGAITRLGSDRSLVALMVPKKARGGASDHRSMTPGFYSRKNPSKAHRTHKIPGVGTLTISPRADGGRDDASLEVTKSFADEWDHSMTNQAYLGREVSEAAEKHRRDSNFYTVKLKYRGREFAIWPSGAGV